MYNRLDELSQSNIYGAGFKFKCILNLNSNYTAEGYPISIIVYSINNDDIFT